MNAAAESGPSAHERWLHPALVVVAVALAWANSLSVPFQFDDHASILQNPTIRHLASMDWLFPPSTGGETVSGRPVLNLTFALNYALGGLDGRGYRLANIAIHAASALLLLGILRRTAAVGRASARFSSGGTIQSGLKAALPLAIVLVWAVHPLHTGAVTYVVQRAESLAGCFILLTLYAFIRAAEAGTKPAVRAWSAVSVATAALGLGTKETAVVAPLLVLLYDRTFLAGTFAAALRVRGRLHAALAAISLVLAALIAAGPGRGASAGWDSDIAPWTYLLTQCDAIVRYVGLAIWPASQVFDYGVPTASGLADVLPQAILLTVAAGGCALALRRNTPAGFAGACFFLLLAPSSSFVPVATQTIAEHRMYLPLAALIAALVAGAARLWMSFSREPRRWLGWVGVVIAVPLATATLARNRIYRSELTLWADTAAKRPDNPRAHNNLGNALAVAGQLDAAANAYRRAIVLQPTHALAHFGLGTVLATQERWTEAVDHFETSVRLAPDYDVARESLAEAHRKLGMAAARERRLDDAAGHFHAVLRVQPDDADAHANLGNVLLLRGDPAGALQHYEAAVRLRPHDARLRENIGLAREALGR